MELNGKHWTRKDLAARGLNDRAIREGIRDGTLHRVGRGLYTPQKVEGLELLQAIRYRYPHIIFDSYTAAGVYGLGEIKTPVSGLLPVGARPIKNELLTASRSRNRRYREVHGLAVTTPAAVAADIPRWELLERVKFLETHYDGLNGKEEFSADYRALNSSQKGALALLLKRAVIGASSRMERLFLLDLRKVGLDVIPNFRFGPYTWDAGFPRGTALVDLDSLRFHGPDTPDTFIVDRWKANHAEMAGWGHLQFTDFCLNDKQARRTAVDEIKRMVEHRRSLRGTRRHPRPVPGRVTDGVWKFHRELSTGR